MFKSSSTLRGIAIGLLTLLFACHEDLVHEIEAPEEVQTAESFSDELIPNQYIVVFNTEKTGDAGARFSDPEKAGGFVKEQTMSIVRSVAPAFSEEQLLAVYSASINGAAVKLTADKIEALRNDERVAYIEQDRIITLGKPSKGGGIISAGSQEKPYGVKRVNGGKTYKGTNVAWVIDTGIEMDHPDLKVGKNKSKSFVDSEPSADDFNGHGTHVAGIIAAKNNTIGVIGVAAGAKVIAVKVLDMFGSGTYSGVIAGVDYVGAKGKAGDVANMSLGGSFHRGLNQAVVKASKKGIYFTLAAGNDSDRAKKYSPASANGKYIFTISAMDKKNKFASFSNYGNPPIDFCAPGVRVKSTYIGRSYTTLSGTSMAAPHAAGVLLLKAGVTGSNGYVKGDQDNKPDPIIYCTGCK